MLVVTGIFENERFIPDDPVSIPQNKRVVVTIEEKPELVTENKGILPADFDYKMEGSITQSLIGAIPHPDISHEDIRSMRLRKYESNN